ncbi:hypothetical protein FRC06_005454 [Ceratobasidium sp. 370]|nr:hypothetical protein FRC06_005454 [Ceratobasidium sp. 370]
MHWLVLFTFAADVLANSVVPVGFGSLHHRRLKRTSGRRVGGTCKPRPTQFPTSTSIVLLPTTLLPTSTAAAPAPATSTRGSTPTSSPAPAPVQGLLAKVLPLGLGSSTNSWTTVANYGTDYSYSLADTVHTLRPTRILGGSLQAVSNAPDGKQSIEVLFGKGSYGLLAAVPGGISFYAYGPSDLTKAHELTFGYSVYFEEGFDWVHGGKLPGLYGGSTDDGAVWYNGKSIWTLRGVMFRGVGMEASVIRGLMVQCFFGG